VRAFKLHSNAFDHRAKPLPTAGLDGLPAMLSAGVMLSSRIVSLKGPKAVIPPRV